MKNYVIGFVNCIHTKCLKLWNREWCYGRIGHVAWNWREMHQNISKIWCVDNI
jgi:hypothetical protein